MNQAKKITLIAALMIAGAVTTNTIMAQETKKDESVLQKAGADVKQGAKAVGNTTAKGAKAVGKGAKKVGNKTAQVAVKGKSAVVDKTYKGKVAPDGSKVYIDKKDKKYYVNKKGKKVYLKASQIKNKKVK